MIDNLDGPFLGSIRWPLVEFEYNCPNSSSIMEFLGNLLTQTNQTKQKKNKNSLNCIIRTVIHFVELLLCSSDCTIWIQQSKQYKLLNFCFVSFYLLGLVNFLKTQILRKSQLTNQRHVMILSER